MNTKRALPPAVIVHSLAHAMAALAPGRPVTLLSAPGAAMFGGSEWWRALIAAARAEHPATAMDDVLDCGDAPGFAVEALRTGHRMLVLQAACPAWPLVAARAAACGATLLAQPPPALDLAVPGAARQLDDWMNRDSEAGLSPT